METTRIATIKAGDEAGKRYVVQRIHFGRRGAANDPDKVHCWGEVVRFRGLRATHASTGRVFLKDAVDVADVRRTPALMQELFDQHVAGLRAKGHVITRGRGGRLTDHGTPEQAAARQRTVERLALELSAVAPADFFVRGHREPAVTRGPDAPIPEARQDVRDRIVERLLSEGAHLQRYSNGEFTSSSVAVGLTFEDCAGVPVLETPGHTVHYDKELGLFWRRGGCWD